MKLVSTTQPDTRRLVPTLHLEACLLRPASPRSDDPDQSIVSDINETTVLHAPALVAQPVAYAPRVPPLERFHVFLKPYLAMTPSRVTRTTRNEL